MPSDKDSDIDSIIRELHRIGNDLRRLRSEPETPYVPSEPDVAYCSFCGKGKREVAVLVEGPEVFICDECVAVAQQIIQDAKTARDP